MVQIWLGLAIVACLGAATWIAEEGGSADAAIAGATPKIYTAEPYADGTVLDCPPVANAQTDCKVGVKPGFGSKILEGDTFTFAVGQTMCAQTRDEFDPAMPRAYAPDPKAGSIAVTSVSPSQFPPEVSWGFTRPDNCVQGVCRANQVNGYVTVTNATAANDDHFQFMVGNSRALSPDPLGDYPAAGISCSANSGLRVLLPQLALEKEVCTFSGQPTAQRECTLDNEAAWVKAADPVPNFPAGTSIMWRIVATNTGNVDLKSVQLSSDVAAALDGARGPFDPDATTCLAASLEPIEFASDGEPGTVDLAAGKTATQGGKAFAGGGRAGLICSSGVGAGFTGRVQNTAKAEATFPDKDINGDDLVDRMPGGKVESNESSATATVEDPKLTLTKEVCSTGTGCIDGSNEDGRWVGTTIVKQDSPAEWRITVTNAGTVAFDAIKLSMDNTAGGTGLEGIPAGCDIGTPFTATGGETVLAPKQSFSITCRTATIHSTTAALTNTAQASGTPLDPNDPSSPLPGYETEPAFTNTDSASVAVAVPGITLKKYACLSPFDETGVGCPEPKYIDVTSPAELESVMSAFGWLDTDDPGDHVVVANNAPIEWLILVQNTGNVPLSEVSVSFDEVTAGDASLAQREPACLGDVTLLGSSEAALRPQAFAYRLCATPHVVATPSSSEVINTAAAQGTPMSYGQPDEKLNGEDTTPVASGTDVARAVAFAPHLSLTKEVCQAGTGCIGDADAVWVHSTMVAVGSDAEWRLTVTNDGTVPVDNVHVLSDHVTGGDTGNGPIPPGCEPQTHFQDGEKVMLRTGESFSLTCVSTNITDAKEPAKNTARAAAQPLDPNDPTRSLPGWDDQLVQTDPADANVIATPATVPTTPATVPATPPVPTTPPEQTIPSGTQAPGQSPSHLVAPHKTREPGSLPETPRPSVPESAGLTLPPTGVTSLGLAALGIALIAAGTIGLRHSNRHRSLSTHISLNPHK